VRRVACKLVVVVRTDLGMGTPGVGLVFHDAA
jgi:hypothetical protein